MFKQIILGTVSLLAVASTAPALVSADTAATSSNCTVKTVGTKNTAGNSDSRFILNKDNTVTSTFIVTGTDCAEAVTIASWQAPDAQKGRPYNEQKLFAHTSGVFSAGTHTLTVALPNCYYQIDLVRGSSATDQNGGPEYSDAQLKGMGSLHGGTQACTPVKPPQPPVTPPTPPTPPTTTTLPNTGTGSNIFALPVITAVVGYAFSIFRKTRAAKA